MTIMTNLDSHKYGDRHLRSDLGGRLNSLDPTSIRRVRLAATDVISKTFAGQHILWMLSNLLARQYAVIHEIHISVPSIPVMPSIALFGEGVDLPTTLRNTIQSIAGSYVSIHTDDEQSCPAVDAEVLVGRENTTNRECRFQVSVWANGWNIYVGRKEKTPTALPDSPLSFGPYFGACIAAGEVFKFLRGLKEGRGKHIDSLFMSLWDFKEYERLEYLPQPKSVTPIALPPCYLIGAGAVGQAAAAALATSDGVRGTFIVIDNDTVDDTNLNRYPLATLKDVGAAKSILLSDHLRAKGFEAYPSQTTWPEYAYQLSHSMLPSHLQDREAQYRYDLVLSCVDKNEARHAIQKFWPKYILGGSTKDMGIAVAAYDMLSEYECLMCNNPLNLDNATIERVAEEVKRLSPELRRSLAAKLGADVTAVENYLAHPRCGHLGEQEIMKFRDTNPGAEWSVGFVSVGAGTLLAAQLVRYALLGQKTLLENGNTMRLSFLNPSPRFSKHLRKEGCECSTGGRNSYTSAWSK